jgi:hypothetical protein
MKDTFKAMVQAEDALRKAQATLDRAEERCEQAPTACNAVLKMYAQDDVTIHTVALRTAKEAHTVALAEEADDDKALAGEYISCGPVCNPDGSPSEFTKMMFGIRD